jgi:two-component system, OmpR family, phosphate regulon sensor histidine kinase PhoR
VSLSSPIFRKLLLASLALILVTLVGADVLLTRYTAVRERDHAIHEMEAQARILVPQLSTAEPAILGEWIRRAAGQSGARVTLIRRDGLVQADSEHDTSTMENHAERPEIRQAFAGGIGTSVRHSATLDVDLCYVAVPAAWSGEPHAVLRLAVPLEQIQAATAQVRWLILRASGVAALFALVFAFFASRAFARRIRRIQAFAGELVRADYSGTLAVESDDELGSVIRSLRGMAEQFREMLHRLREESARRNAILAGMVEGVLAVDNKLRVTFYNESFAQAIKAQLPIPQFLPLVKLVRDPGLLALLKEVLATNAPARRRLTLAAAGARVFDVQAAPLEEQPSPGAIAILHDVTEIERLERVRKDFVSNISHELRTPLASIRGYAETLLDGALEDPKNNRKFIEVIDDSAARLSDLAADLMTLSELESEHEPPISELVPVRETAQAAIRIVESEAAASGIKLSCELADLHIAGHRFRLERALVNLLQNAIRYNRRNGEVRLEAGMLDGKVRITVSDTGFGIPSSDLPRIFERFYCVDKAHSRAHGGTGVGLSIVKHTVESMSGTITVESQLGTGSTFAMLFSPPAST